MTQKQHTLAPWKVEGQDIIGNEPNGFICTCSGRTANARLIAAAPDMLAFIEKVAAWDFTPSKYSFNKFQSEYEIETAQWKAFALIKKVRG